MYPQPGYVSSSPSSSLNVTPSSSPPFGPVDSSPPSSPTFTPYELDAPDVSFSHPFAASTKAVKRLPHYEKKTAIPPCTPPGTFARLHLRRGTPASWSLQDDDWSLASSDSDLDPTSHRPWGDIERGEKLWDKALREAFDKGLGKIDLSNKQIESIPASIGELSRFFNTSESSEQSLSSGRASAWRRVDTEPSPARSFDRAQSIRDFGKERHVIMLYLMGNMITSLPSELFSVKNITVLSLRGNKLTFIPPDICRLPNLYELNISNNQLEFLPWEMRDMKIERFLVHPNPFRPEPEPPSLSPSPRRSLRSRRSITRLHSLRKDPPSQPILSSVEVTTLEHVPSLRELCLRLLLVPSEQTPMKTVMEEYYDLPWSDQWALLKERVPGDLRSEDSSTGMGTCPNPAHKGRVFVKHASERFSWEHWIAGVHVGGAVPLRWQGCRATCLDFLDKSLEVPQVGAGLSESAAMNVVGGGAQDEDDAMDVDMAVQVVNLEDVSLDMDDFDD